MLDVDLTWRYDIFKNSQLLLTLNSVHYKLVLAGFQNETIAKQSKEIGTKNVLPFSLVQAVKYKPLKFKDLDLCNCRLPLIIQLFLYL